MVSYFMAWTLRGAIHSCEGEGDCFSHTLMNRLAGFSGFSRVLQYGMPQKGEKHGVGGRYNILAARTRNNVEAWR